jgi:hypothetical protein
MLRKARLTDHWNNIDNPQRFMAATIDIMQCFISSDSCGQASTIAARSLSTITFTTFWHFLLSAAPDFAAPVSTVAGFPVDFVCCSTPRGFHRASLRAGNPSGPQGFPAPSLPSCMFRCHSRVYRVRIKLSGVERLWCVNCGRTWPVDAGDVGTREEVKRERAA